MFCLLYIRFSVLTITGKRDGGKRYCFTANHQNGKNIFERVTPMKRLCTIFVAYVLLASVVLFLTTPSAWADKPAKTLKDLDTGMEEHLYPSPDKSEKDLLLYVNDRFGYSVKVPHEIFTEVVLIPDNGDGIILESKDGKSRFRASGGYVMDEDMLKASFEDARAAAGGDKKISYENIGNDFWELCWWDGDIFHQHKFVMDREVWADCEIYYQASMDEGTEHPLDELSLRSLQSLELAKG
jgi:hypothetical protein